MSRELLKKQSYFVVKDNTIIQKARFSLSLQQQKILLYMISKIKPFDEPYTCYTVPIKEFCQICGIDCGNGKNYINAKESLKTLRDKSMYVKLDNGDEILLAWLDRVRISAGKGTITVRFHEDMFPFLLNLKEQYTQYSLANVLPMQSKYGIRLYELLKSYEHMGHVVTFSIDELKKRIDCQNYTRFQDLRRRALDVAVNDINAYSDIRIKYTAIKRESRSYNAIKFLITAPQPGEWAEQAMRNVEEIERYKIEHA